MTTNFLGIPIEGDINRGEIRKPQRPLEEFAPLLQAVLDDPLIDMVGWGQWTPYFNDGDPCVFSANTPWFLTTKDAEKLREEDLGLDDFDEDDFTVTYGEHPTLGKKPYSWKPGATYVGEHPVTFERCYALGTAVESEAFNDVLLTAFGDHAKIRITREKIEVEFYDHD